MTEKFVLAEKDKQAMLMELDSIINFMPSMLIGVDIDGRVTLCNNKAAEYLKLSREETLGKQVMAVMADLKEELVLIKQK